MMSYGAFRDGGCCVGQRRSMFRFATIRVSINLFDGFGDARASFDRCALHVLRRLERCEDGDLAADGFGYEGDIAALPFFGWEALQSPDHGIGKLQPHLF